MILKNLSFLLFALVLFSCNNEESKDKNSKPPTDGGRVLASSNGGPLDIVVVAKVGVWQSEAGDAFRKYFTAPQDGLPQAEAVFNVVHIEPSKFNSVLKRSRNVVILEKDTSDSAYLLYKNSWSKPQLVATFTAKSYKALRSLIYKNHEKLFKSIKDQEVIVRQKLSKRIGLLTNHKVLETHNISMDIPISFEVDQENENLLVLWNKTVKTDQAIIIHFQPMDPNEYSLGRNIIPLRDSITKLYIHGQKEGSYMKTERLLDPVITSTLLSDQFALETRGLWKTVGEFKGGPFINYTIYDEKNQQVIFLDAFIYSPETKKRNFLLELESILKTIKI